jgi:osmoprotectant transport system substrate-binding protein
VATLVATAVLGATAGCESSPPESENREPITVGAQAAFDNRVVAAIYGQALEASGIEVYYNSGIGSRTDYLQAMQNGTVDIVPDYTGSLFESLSGNDKPQSSEVTRDALAALLDPFGISVLEESTAEKGRTFVVTEEFAREHSLETIADLEPLAGSIVIGSSKGAASLEESAASLQRAYGVDSWKFAILRDNRSVIEQLDAGEIHVADLSTTSLSIEKHSLVRLRDVDDVLEPQNLVPVVNNNVLTADVAVLLNRVSALLTTTDLVDFAAEKGSLPESVAERWLVEHDVAGAKTLTD